MKWNKNWGVNNLKSATKRINIKPFETLIEIIERGDELKTHVDNDAYNLSDEFLPYDVLCWELAEYELIFEKGKGEYSEQDEIERAEEIYDLSLSYLDICWLISGLKVYLERSNKNP